MAVQSQPQTTPPVDRAESSWLQQGIKWLASIGSVALATCLVVHLEGIVEPTPNSLFFCAVIFSAWFGGWGPGILSAILSVLAVKYYATAPFHELSFSANQCPRLIFFLATGLFISWLTNRQKMAERALRMLSNDLDRKVRERTAELQKKNEELHSEMAERKRTEENLRRTEANLAHVSRVTTLGEMTASIAHEVKQPLTAIVNNANACITLLENDSQDRNEIREALGDIVHDGERAAAVVERVRALVKKSPPKLAPCDLGSLVTNVLALPRPESVPDDIVVTTDLPKPLPLVLGDEIQLQQVLLNLVMNSMEAMAQVPRERRKLEISARLEPHEENSGVVLSVKDYGTGLNASDTDRIFNAFYTTKSHGLGMGLAISRSIVESHGGRLWVESVEGQGATFLFWLPELNKNNTDR
jgi:C4-dicarboxylate-specific signal transduction histidine kinase